MDALAAASLDALDPARWNRAAAGRVAGRYEIVAALDADKRQHESLRYYALAAGDEYRAVARVSHLSGKDRALAIHSLLFGRAARALAHLRLSPRDMAVCGWRFGRAANVLVAPESSLAERAQLLHAVCESIEAEAEGRTIVFPDVLENEELLGNVLLERGYIAAGAAPVAFLDVTWRSFEGYVEGLKRTNKKWASVVRHEINRFRRSGAVVEPLSTRPEDHERVCELLNRHHARLNGRSPGYGPALLRRLQDALGDDLLGYVTRAQPGEPINGACLGAKFGADAALPWIGVDHEASGANFTYFNLAYYAPAADYPRHGVAQVCLGNAAYDAKVKRGCRLVGSRVYVRAPSAVRRSVLGPLVAAQRAWYRRKFARYLTVRA